MAGRSVRRVKFQFKWTKELIFLLVGIAALIIVTVVLALPSKTDKLREKWGEAGLTDETVIVASNIDNIKKEIENGSYIFVFYGTPSDASSVENIKTIDAEAKKFGVEKVYWLDSEYVVTADEEKKESADFKRQIDEWEELLQVEDMMVTSALFAYNNKEIYVDTTKNKTATFAQSMRDAFGPYKVANDNK